MRRYQELREREREREEMRKFLEGEKANDACWKGERVIQREKKLRRGVSS